MRGGVIFFRGAGAAARAYLESDHSHADEYYLEHGSAVAEWSALNAAGEQIDAARLDGEAYQSWVDWIDPVTGERRGVPREATRISEEGAVRALPSSPRFAEMTVNCDKSLSVAAALSPAVSAALDEAQQSAVQAMNSYMAAHSVTRVGPLGAQRLVPVERLEAVAVVHRSSRAGDPHRHVHVQWNTRVLAEGKWRGLHTAATIKQQGALRGVGEAAINSHAGLRSALAAAGFTFDASGGKVVELAAHARLLSKRSRQIEQNVQRLEHEWRAAHPDSEPSAALRRKWNQQAWSIERPRKRHDDGSPEAIWIAELQESGLAVDGFDAQEPAPAVSLFGLDRGAIAHAAIGDAEARTSAWSVADLEGFIGVEVGRHDVTASPDEVRAFVRDLALDVAARSPQLAPDVDGEIPEWVRTITSERVLRIENELRATLGARGAESGLVFADVAVDGLDEHQAHAAHALASSAPLVVVEGAAGSGKTKMLGAALQLSHDVGRELMVVAPTLRAAQEAGAATGANASSAHKIVHEYGYRWDDRGHWTRLTIGELDAEGRAYEGPSEGHTLSPSTRLVVDEAGMLDQDLAHALLTIADETGAPVAFIGDRQQLPAVGRGGVLDMAVAAHPRPLDMAEVHRFQDPEYARLTLGLRDREDPERLFAQLHERGNIVVHSTQEEAQAALLADTLARARAGESVAVAVTSNDQADVLNGMIQRAHADAGNTRRSLHDVAGSDGLTVRVGDRVMTRRNDAGLGVANREVWSVRRVHRDGAVSVVEGAREAKLPAEYVHDHLHLAYASTVYGVQGATVDHGHGLVDESTSAQSLYVAATRGREANTLHVVADSTEQARELFTQALGREAGDRGTRAAITTAERDVAGLDLAAEISVDETLRSERRAAEQSTYESRMKAWTAAHDRWQRSNPELSAEKWSQRLEAAQLDQRQAVDQLSTQRDVAAAQGEAQGRARWNDDWQRVDHARTEREQSSVLNRRRLQSQLDDAERAFRENHQQPPAPEPGRGTIEQWRSKAQESSPDVAAAAQRVNAARAELAKVEKAKPPFGDRPKPPTRSTPIQEAERDHRFQQQRERAEQRRQSATRAHEPGLSKRQDGPKLGQ